MAPAHVIPYDFSVPDTSFALPRALVEISGLTVLDSVHLGAVQDERGLLFVIESDSGSVVAEQDFGGRGDYEGLELVGDSLWILQSDGDLFVANNSSNDLSATKVRTSIRGSCDAEGLTFDELRNRLLISCKETPGRGLGRTRAIYSFELESHQTSDGPVYLLEREGLDAPRAPFKPAAIAVHPITRHLYIVSSVRKVLVVIDMEDSGRIVGTRTLSSQLFPQPEGIAFFPDGTLFIANEGRGSTATLLRFNALPTSP